MCGKLGNLNPDKLFHEIKQSCYFEGNSIVLILKVESLLSYKKKNEISPFAATWRDLEITILREISQTEKDKYYISFLCVYGTKK